MHVWSPGDIRHPPLPLFALNSIPQWTCSTDWLAREPRGPFCLHPSGLEWQSRAVMSCCLHGYWGSRLRSSCLISKCFTLCPSSLALWGTVHSLIRPLIFATLGIKTMALGILGNCASSEWHHSSPIPHPKHTSPFGNAGATTALKELLNFPAKTDIRYGWMASLLFYGNKNMEKWHTSSQTEKLVVTIGTSNQVCWPL